MYVPAEAISVLTTAFASLGTIYAVVLGGILGGLIALMGLNYGVKKTIRYITGNAPGWYGYDSSKGSGESYYHPRKNTRSASGSLNLLD